MSPRSTLLVLGALAALATSACNDAVAKAKDPSQNPLLDEGTLGLTTSGPRRVAADGGLAGGGPRPPPVQILQPNHGSTVGALERPVALRRFFEALASLESGSLSRDVRIVQYGDSHTAADMETGTIRRALAARFGDGGRGFVQIGKPWKSYYQEGVRTGMTSEFSSEKGKSDKLRPGSEGMFGLGGASVIASKKGARAWAELSSHASRIELSYLQQPQGGSFEVLVDGHRVARVVSKGVSYTSAFRSIELPDGPHQVEVRASGDGEIRLFGLALDKPQVGITYDALGINGARVTALLGWNELHMLDQLRHRAPSLVVLAYGTNESGDDTPREVYERHLVDALGRLLRAVPGASCLLIGPPDRAIETRDGWITSPRLLEIVASQKRVAEVARCAYYDQLAAMGGEGAIAGWALEEPPRAQKDRVHLTREGYAQMGGAFVSDALRAYAMWRAERGLPPSRALAQPVPPPPPPGPPPPGPESPNESP